jgi:2-hydroxymuconate-semialdehyde hydrolase
VFRDYPAILRAIPAPTLLIHGRRDPYIPLADSLRALEVIPAAKLVVVDEGAHFLPIDTPEEVGHALNRFLQ